MSYYKIHVGTRTTVVRSEASLEEMGESYKDDLIGECDKFGNLMVPYLSPEVTAMLEEAAREFNGRYQYCGKTLSFIDTQDPTKPVDWFEVEREHAKDFALAYQAEAETVVNNPVKLLKEPRVTSEPTYGETIQTEKRDLGLDTFELPVIWNLVDIYPRYEPKYKRRWKIEINGSSYWIYAMHDSQVEHYTRLYGEGEAPKLIEFQIEARRPDPVEEAFQVQTPVTPEEVGVVELTPGGSFADDRATMLASLREMSFSRSKPTAAGGFTVPMHEGIQLSRQIENYRQILISVAGERVSQSLNDADLLKVMPHVLETLKHARSQARVGCWKCDYSANGCSCCETYFTNGIHPKLYEWVFGEKATHQPDPVELTPIEEAAVKDSVLTVAEFKVNFPLYPLGIYHDYLRAKMEASAKANKPFMITDHDTLVEAQNAIQGKSAMAIALEQNPGLTEEAFFDSLRMRAELDPNYPNPLGDSTVREHRKTILKLMDEWWVEIQCETDLGGIFGTNRLEFIRKEYSRHRKYVKRLLLDIIEPTDTQDDFKIDRTEKGTFNLLGKGSDGEWFRPLSLTFNTRGHFELFEGLDD